MISTIFDPSGLGPIPRIPLVPADILKRHRCLRPTDDRFKAAARLLQSLWRQDQGFPVGDYLSPDGKRRTLGSRLPAAVGRTGAAFLSPQISRLVRRELTYREIGAVIDPERLYLNLLSSQQLTFNLFGELKLHLDLATAVFRRLLPGRDLTVDDIWFEHAPGRRSRVYTSDSTAFDVLVRYRTPQGSRGFIAIEIKYSEGMVDPLAGLKTRYDELSQLSGLYLNPESEALRKNPLQQLWREHLLAQSMLDQGLYTEGQLLLIGPEHNWKVQLAASRYQAELVDTTTRHVGFKSYDGKWVMTV